MLVCYACETQLPDMLQTQLMGNANCYILYLKCVGVFIFLIKNASAFLCKILQLDLVRLTVFVWITLVYRGSVTWDVEIKTDRAMGVACRKLSWVFQNHSLIYCANTHIMTWDTGSFQLSSTSICNLTVFYGHLCLLEETDGDRMTSSAAEDAQYIGYDQNDGLWFT